MNVVFVLTDNMLAAGTMLPIEMWRAAEQTRVGASVKRTEDQLKVITTATQPRAVHFRQSGACAVGSLKSL